LFSLMRSAPSAPVAALAVAGESAKDKIGQPIVPAWRRHAPPRFRAEYPYGPSA